MDRDIEAPHSTSRVKLCLPIASFHEPSRPIMYEMPLDIWHEADQGGKRASAEIMGASGWKFLCACGLGGTVRKGKFASNGLEKRDLASIRVDEPDDAPWMADSDDNPRQAAPASKIKPQPGRFRNELGKLHAVTDMAPFEIGER